MDAALLGTRKYRPLSRAGNCINDPLTNNGGFPEIISNKAFKSPSLTVNTVSPRSTCSTMSKSFPPISLVNTFETVPSLIIAVIISVIICGAILLLIIAVVPYPIRSSSVAVTEEASKSPIMIFLLPLVNSFPAEFPIKILFVPEEMFIPVFESPIFTLLLKINLLPAATVILSVALSYVNPGEPPKELLSLYWNCVLVPPGVPEPETPWLPWSP